jgi:hypothetical protein
MGDNMEEEDTQKYSEVQLQKLFDERQANLLASMQPNID